MKKRILFFLAFLLNVQFTIAQTEQVSSTDSVSVKGRLGLMGRWQTGNLNQISIMPNGFISLSKQSYYLELTSTYHFLKVGGFKAINDLWNYGLFQLNPNRKIFPSAHTIMGFAKSYQIDHSVVIGVGIGANIYKKSPGSYLQVHVYGDFLNFQYTEEILHEAFAIGSLIRATFPISSLINFRWELSSFHSTKDKTFWGGANNFQISFKVLKNLMININHQTQYNNQTTAIIKNTNTEMLFGIQYQISN